MKVLKHVAVFLSIMCLSMFIYTGCKSDTGVLDANNGLHSTKLGKTNKDVPILYMRTPAAWSATPELPPVLCPPFPGITFTWDVAPQYITDNNIQYVFLCYQIVIRRGAWGEQITEPRCYDRMKNYCEENIWEKIGSENMNTGDLFYWWTTAVYKRVDNEYIEAYLTYYDTYMNHYSAFFYDMNAPVISGTTSSYHPVITWNGIPGSTNYIVEELNKYGTVIGTHTVYSAEYTNSRALSTSPGATGYDYFIRVKAQCTTTGAESVYSNTIGFRNIECVPVDPNPPLD